MLFISLTKFRAKPTDRKTNGWHKHVDPVLKRYKVKIVATFWTLGKYDAVILFDAPAAKNVMKFLYEASDMLETETMSAITDQEADALLG